MSFLKKIFSGKKGKAEAAAPEISQEEYHEYYVQKEQALESVLGKMNDIVGHAIIPFDVGGAVDMYYFQNHIQGVGFATMELLDPKGNGPKPNMLGTYELVAFTKQSYNDAEETQTPFDLIERRICGIFTTIGNYSFQAVLNPNETCEIPGDDNEEGKYLIFDNYQPEGTVFKIGERNHHLLLCMEIFKSEMEFARAEGGSKLLEKLKQAEHYPYSDLNRSPV